MEAIDRSELEALRLRAGYESCVTQAQRFNMKRKLEHWTDDDAVDNALLFRLAFGSSRRVRKVSLKGKTLAECLYGHISEVSARQSTEVLDRHNLYAW